MQVNSHDHGAENFHTHRQSGDAMGHIFKGLVIIWLGIVLYLNNMDWLNGDWWAYFLLGIGILMISETLVRIARRESYSVGYGRLIGGAVLVAIGANNIYELADWWPLIFVAVGLAIILMNLQQTDHTQPGVDN